MAIFEITFQARCKHCSFAEGFHPTNKDGSKSKRWLTKCSNPKSKQFEKQIAKKDLVCEHWKF